MPSSETMNALRSENAALQNIVNFTLLLLILLLAGWFGLVNQEELDRKSAIERNV